MNCLLDTCALVWLADDPTKLPPAVRRVLADGESAVYASAVSALELGIKVARKKLQLPMPISRWFPATCHRNELSILDISAPVATASCELPDIHRDPFDRVLIATAIQRRLRLATPDETIQRYPDLKTIW